MAKWGLVNKMVVAFGPKPSSRRKISITDIIFVAENGGLAEFEMLIQTDPSRLRVRDIKGQSVAHKAAARNRVKILQFIAAQSPGLLEEADNAGDTPLHTAVSSEALEALDFLMQQGVDASVLNHKKQAPLHQATEMNKAASLRQMARHKHRFDPMQGGEHGRNALHLAAIHDHDECARILLSELGLCLQKPCANGNYPIHEAAKHASSRTMEVFLQWAEANGVPRAELISLFDAEGNVPLHSAVHGGDYKVAAVELCLKSGARISTQQHDLSTPVHLACSQGSLVIIRLMFEIQPGETAACLSSSDLQRRTPLHCAAMFDHSEVVEFLVENGADLEVVDREHRSPLLLAASRSCWRTVHTLLRLGAKPNLQDSLQRNVLHLIVIHGGKLQEFAEEVAPTKADLMELLNQKDELGCAPVHYASQAGHLIALKNLLSLGAAINVKNNRSENALHFAARYGRYHTALQLLDSEKGSVIINESDGDGLTPLHIASKEGHIRVVQLLLGRGALLHRDHLGRTPLHLAAMKGHTDVMELLLTVHMYLLDQLDKEGNTALHLAAMENRPNAATLLLEVGCRLIQNKKGRSAVDYAIVYKNPEAALAMATNKTRAEELMTLRSEKYPCVTMALIAFMPRVFEAVLDSCITRATCRQDSKEYFIKYDFNCLRCPEYEDNEELSEEALKMQLDVMNAPLPALNVRYDFKYYQMAPEAVALYRRLLGDPEWRPPPLTTMNAMVSHGRVDLLGHPLSQKYLQMKWNAYGKYFHVANLVLYVIYLFFVTWFGAQLMGVDEEELKAAQELLVVARDVGMEGLPSGVGNNTTMGWDVEEDLTTDSSQESVTKHPQDIPIKGREMVGTPMIYISAVVVLVFMSLNTVRELLQIEQQRFRYVLDPLNIMAWMLNVTAATMTSAVFLGHAQSYHFSCASIAVFVSWFYLLMYLQRFDRVGIYVVMFLEILSTLLKVLLVFSLLIVAFGLAFHILLAQGHHMAFSNIPLSLLRTFSMMLGEMDFLATFIHPLFDKDDSFHSSQRGIGGHKATLPFPTPTFIILGLFLVLMPILLMNLLIGLAVGDIESVRRNAQLKRLAMQVELHTELEQRLPRRLLNRIDRSEIIDYPNESRLPIGCLETLIRRWFSRSLHETIGDAGNDLSQDFICSQMEQQSLKLRELAVSLETEQRLLKLILQKMEIKVEAEDEDEGVKTNDMNTSGISCKWTSANVSKTLRNIQNAHKGFR